MKRIIVSILLVLMVFSCKMNGGLQSGEKCAYIVIDTSDRNETSLVTKTVLPTSFDKNNLSYSLYGKLTTESSNTLLGSWESYDALCSMTKINVSVGKWTFTLNGLKDGVVVLTSTISKTIDYGNNSLYFVMNEADAGNGSLEIDFKYPLIGIEKVSAGLFDLSGDAVTGFSVQNLSSTIQNSKRIVKYKKSSVPKGSYILRFYLYQYSNDQQPTNVYSEVVRIAPGNLTTGILEIVNINSVYNIEYELNGGDWDDDIYIPLSYTNYSEIALPTYLHKDGFIFAGWYDNEDLLGSKTTSIPLGENGGKKYWAKWVDEITCSLSEFKTIFSGINNGSCRVNITDVNPNIALLKSIINSNGVKVKLDLSACSSITTIPSNAFSDCANLSGVILPSSLTKIEDYAFCNDLNLTLINLSDNISTIGASVFSGCSSLAEIDLGSKLKTIGNLCFKDCSSLETITIPDSTTSIGIGAFENCKSLTEVHLGDGVDRIAKSLFYNCSALETVTMSDNVEEIGDAAFFSCSNLESLILSSSLLNIYQESFANCASLNNITLPVTLSSIGNRAFKNCGRLKNIIIPDSVNQIGESVFEGCSSIEITINNLLLNTYAHSSSDTDLSNKFLMGAENYSIVVIGGSTSLGDYLFYDCKEMKSITLPENLKSIGNYTFRGCKGLNKIEIPSSVESVGNSAFAGCSSLQDLIMSDSISAIGDYAFVSCSNLLFIDLKNVLTIGDYAFQGCKKITDLVIPDSTTSVGRGLFYGINNLNITIKSSLLSPYKATSSTYRSHSNELFAGSSGLTINLSQNSTSLYPYLFCNATQVKQVNLPSTITAIPEYTFYKCSNLKIINISGDLTNIGQYCFYSCSKLKSISFSAPSFETIPDYAFYGCSSLENITLPITFTTIGDFVFYNCSSLLSVNLPSDLIAIGTNAFNGCKKLESLVIPDGVTSIGDYALCNMGVLSITISIRLINDHPGKYNPIKSYYSYSSEYYEPYTACNLISGDNIFVNLITDSNSKVISDYAFLKCQGLTGITIPEGITKLGAYSFYGNTNLVSVSLPSTISIISKATFYNCKNLSSCDIPDSVTSIGSCAFCYCSSLNWSSFPAGVVKVYTDSFYGCQINSIVPNSLVKDDGDGYKFDAKVFDKVGSQNQPVVYWAAPLIKPTGNFKIYCTTNEGSGASISGIKQNSNEINKSYQTSGTEESYRMVLSNNYGNKYFACVSSDKFDALAVR